MYVVFDLDATLADVVSVDMVVWEMTIKKPVPNTLLDRTYRKFVKKVAQQEKSDTPLGILRPGVIEIMKRLLKKRARSGLKGVIIYSNNSQLQSLEFIRDVIHDCIGTHSLIIDLIHRLHPLRYLEGEEMKTAAPNTYPKTWKTLKRILIEGKAKALKTIQPKDIIFIDDMIHEDLYINLPRGNYINLKPYIYECPFIEISTLYYECLQDEGIFDNDNAFKHYLNVIKGCDPKITGPSKNVTNSEIFIEHMSYYYSQSRYKKYNDATETIPPKDYDAISTIMTTIKARHS